MIKILIIIMFLISILFNSTKTPLSMGLMLLLQTLLITITSGLMSFNFWYAYMLFLIMLGGMLILFIYVSSISSNLKFFFNKKIMLMNFLFLFMIIFYTFNSKIFIMFNSDMLNFMNIEIEQNFLLKMSMNKLYNNPTNQIMILLINYLLMTLFIVVKITNINLGPLRKNL